MDILKAILELIKGILTMNKPLSAWRFIAILFTVILSFAVWKLPEILSVLLH